MQFLIFISMFNFSTKTADTDLVSLVPESHYCENQDELYFIYKNIFICFQIKLN